MNTPTASPSLPSAHADLPPGTLDERIALAEQRLVSREQGIRRRAQDLLLRAQDVTKPRRLVRPAGYVLGAVALLWVATRLLQRRRDANLRGTLSPQAPAARAASSVGEVPWARAAGLLWPFLPAAWRGRLGLDSASHLVAVGVPLAALLFRKRTQPPLQSTRPD